MSLSVDCNDDEIKLVVQTNWHTLGNADYRLNGYYYGNSLSLEGTMGSLWDQINLKKDL